MEAWSEVISPVCCMLSDAASSSVDSGIEGSRPDDGSRGPLWTERKEEGESGSLGR